MTVKNEDHIHTYYAALMFVVLVQQVLSPSKSKRMGYLDLAKSAGYPKEFLAKDEFRGQITKTMTRMSELLDECQAECSERLPLIQGLVVQKDDEKPLEERLPGPGFWRVLDVPENKRGEFMQEEEARIVEFGVKWKGLTVNFNMKALKRLYD